jgi:hypothetical protein
MFEIRVASGVGVKLLRFWPDKSLGGERRELFHEAVKMLQLL